MLLIKNAKLIGYNNLMDILINNEKIIKIDENIYGENTKIIDAKGNYTLPGMIDVHTHMREPGFTQKEDFLTGSKACAKGGITTFIDMPNTNPATIDIESLYLKRELAKKSIVNYGFHFGGSYNDNSNEIKKAKNICSTKIFMNVSTGKMLIEDDEILDNIFKTSKKISVHAEGEMVEKAIKLAIKHDKPLYLCHISTKEELKIIKKYKKEYKNIYCEVTPHHLFLTKKNKTYINIMKPELKTDEDVKALWEAIEEGVIDTIGTDHAPHLLKEKEEKITFGIPGVETSLALLITAYKNNKISLEKIIKMYSENPAKIFDIKCRGRLEEGYFADIIIVDIKNKYTLKNENIVSKCGYTSFNGWDVYGKVITTIVNGRKIFENDEFYDNRGREVDINE
ncbi:dihydroorotase [Hypnocyclicus thermotrophus]|uniref:Dihydroorotase n=1 Tax=Hypnocyclicus thermotrophus TaxID=1627895 RepID=A0AA46DXC8_9FUSO|nr:dihydroorotase family protein [Hypnocyclicus thermotrophus]TDT67400.1 dihydroorotase [Hypnocyclicus thermotrophus]